MSLTRRDRAKVNAALLELRSAGHDIAGVTAIAGKLIDMGTPAKAAYDRAFKGVVAAHPSLHAPLQRIGQMIDACDNATLARYNVAMSNYIATGDAAHIEAIAPKVQHHLAEMARQTGDAGFADPLPDNTGAPANGDRPGWAAGGYSAQQAQAAPAAPLPAKEPGRPGWGPMGYSASVSSAETSDP